MKLFCQENCLEVGLDEVARGCLFGRVYAAAVIWPQDEELSLITKDSKKYTKAQREDLVEYIQAYAIDYAVGYVEAEQIDQIMEGKVPDAPDSWSDDDTSSSGKSPDVQSKDSPSASPAS